MQEKNLLFKIKDVEKVILRKLIPYNEMQDAIPEVLKRPTPTQMQIIGYILDNIDKEIYQKDLEEVLNLRRATVSDVLQRMEKNRLIKREVSLNDTRQKKIILDNKAKEIFNTNAKKVEELEKIAVKGIPEEHLKIFSDVLEKMIENMNT